LWCAPDSCHSKSLPVIVGRVVEVVLALSKIDDLELKFVGNEQVCWLDVSVTNSLALQERASRDHAAVHSDKLLLGPVLILLLPSSIQVLQILMSIHVLSHYAQFVRIILRLTQVIPVSPHNVRVTLQFHELYGLLFVLVQLVEVFGLYLFEGIHLTC
jgi:hypothetical protein